VDKRQNSTYIDAGGHDLLMLIREHGPGKRPHAHEKIDEAGNVTDQETRDKIEELLEALITWMNRLKEA